MVDVFRENPLEHTMETLNARALEITCPAPRLEQKERIRVQRRGVQIVWIRVGDATHGLRVGFVLIDALLGIEFLDIPHGHRVDECPLFGGSPACP